MKRGVQRLDLDEVRRAVDLLREEGFAVDGIDEVGPDEDGHGVAFSLSVYAPSRNKSFNRNSMGTDETTKLPVMTGATETGESKNP